MNELKPNKILKYRVSNPNYIGYSKCTGKFETKQEAITTVKNWLVDVIMEDGGRKQYVDQKIDKECKDNQIIFTLTTKERLTSGHIKERKELVTRIIKPIKWEVVYE